MAARKKLKAVSPPEDGMDSVDSLFSTFQQIRPGSTQWLLPGRIVGNSIAILEGDPSAGKSTFLAGLCAAITTGKQWMDRPKSKPAGVLYLSPEEDPATMIQPRLNAAGADMRRIHCPSLEDNGTRRSMRFPGCLQTLRQFVRANNVALVIADPLSSHLPGDSDINNEQSVRHAFDGTQRYCNADGFCVLFTRHWRKDRSGPRLSWGMGSVAIGACARSVLSVEQPDQFCERRILRVVKCNQANKTPPLAYTFDYTAGPPVMVHFVPLTRREDDDATADSDTGDRDARGDARRLLQELLKTESVDSQVVMKEAALAMIGERTLRKAKADLGVISDRVVDGSVAVWKWRLPPKVEQEGGSTAM